MIIAIIVFIIVLVVGWSLLKTAKESDEIEEQLIREMIEGK